MEPISGGRSSSEFITIFATYVPVSSWVVPIAEVCGIGNGKKTAVCSALLVLCFFLDRGADSWVEAVINSNK